MKRVFADTLYWIALINPRDQWRQNALQISQAIDSDSLIVTTDDVLTETLNYFSKGRQELRVKASHEIRAILLNVNIEIVSCSHDAFLDGITLYEKRPDKGYSLTDCISMNVCREKGITDILTHDDHFVQEGFRILV
ncbi:MAG: type II toxin-antitoxin system VapC family toxin [Pyrinomonadaceae bacterium]|nr:type II toxin-antitoxin system VapC family toxin [Pyrinomonadaceae bacterium]